VRNPPWTRDELILVLDLFFRLGRTQASQQHPDVIALSQLLNKLPTRFQSENFRNPNSVHMKLGNLLRIDPRYPGRGLSRGSVKEQDVWNDFASNPDLLRETAQAIRQFAEQGENDIPIERSEDIEVQEGSILFRQHRARERNSSIVREKKRRAAEAGALVCEVCGFSFEEIYGPLGEGFIECHHTVPLPRLHPGTKTRLSDLALVCSNCHRMLHRGGIHISVMELRDIIARSAASR
jgi:5-methylcytosine-specific restriction enzyme A